MGAARALAQQPIEILRDQLKTCSLFADSDTATLDAIAPHFEAVVIAAGEPIILENENNDHVYFIVSGSVEIVGYLPDEKRVQRLALLKPGSQFADFSVLTQSNKSGSAYAYDECQLLRVHGTKFLEILQKFPVVSRKLVVDLANLNQRVESSTEFIPFYQSTQLKVQREITELIPIASWKRYGIIPLSLKSGLLSVAVKDLKNEEFFQFASTQLNKVEINAFLMDEEEYDGAIETVTSWLKNPQPGAAKSKSENQGAADLKQLLRENSLTKSLAENVLTQLEGYLKPVTLKPGQVFAMTGPALESMYLVQKGQIEINRVIPQSRGRAHVMVVSAGELIGDVALLTGKPVVHAHRALEETILIPIPKAVITQLLATPVFSFPLACALAKRLQKLNGQAGVSFFKASEVPDLKGVFSLIPLSVINEHKVMPLKFTDGEVCLGSVRSNHRRILQEIGRYLSEYRIKFLGITEEQFNGYSNQLRTIAQTAAADLGQPQIHATTKAQILDPVRLLDDILLHGMNSRASDLHFEPGHDVLTVRYRIDGVMHERPEKTPIAIGREVVNRIKILAQMDIANSKITQDGQFKTQIQDLDIVARASVLPLKHGEKAVLRLVRGQSNVVPLNMLVPDRRAIGLLQQVCRCRQGLFLVTGPTGSGKTTTLYSMLREINRVGINVVTLEDPVEMEIPGLNQCEIERKRGLDFAHALRAVLRQDPDVIMVGEIRDEESAKIVFEAAVTGHLVLSTLHTSFAVDVGPRLLELGVPASTVAAGLLGVLTQRLVRAVCKKCVAARPLTMTERSYAQGVLGSTFTLPDEVRVGKGCPACNNTGYHDRIPVMEVWRNTLPMHKAIIDNASPEELIRVAREDGFETLLEFGVKMALAGLTTIDEVKRCLSSV